MWNVRRNVMLSSIGLMAIGTVCRAQSQDTLSRAIDHVFDRWRNTISPGCAIGVSRNGVPVFEKGYGMANLETMTPITPSSIFHVASISKQFTATAIMLLERERKLSLDDDIRKYLPELPDYGTAITVRDLLAHTDGVRDMLELLYFARGRFEEDRITEGDALDIITRQTALNAPPGSEYLYGNSGYVLLAEIIKRVSGQPLREFAATRIFEPLGMTHTLFHDRYDAVVPGRTSAYEPVAGAGGPWRVSLPPYDFAGPTSLFTTVEDLLKWEANLDHPVVGDAAVFAHMLQGQTLTNGDTIEYGLGMRTVRRYRGTRVAEVTGNDPGYQAYAGRYLDEQLAIAVTCNAGSAVSPTALAHGVADVLLGSALAPVSKPVVQAGVAIPVERLTSRVGVYLQPTTMTVAHVVMKDGRLVFDGPAGGTLVPLAENRFTVAGQSGDVVFVNGPHASFQRRVPGQRPVTYEWRETPNGDTSLAPYAGDYVSTDLGGSHYQIRVDGSTLALRAAGTSGSFVAREAFADTFIIPFGGGTFTIQFTRAGQLVTGFEVTSGRMRRVTFVKQP